MNISAQIPHAPICALNSDIKYPKSALFEHDIRSSPPEVTLP